MTLHRRSFLGIIGVGTTGLAGYTGDTEDQGTTSTVSPPPTESTQVYTLGKTGEQPDWTKTFGIYATNQTGEEQTLNVVVERDGNQLVDESCTLGVKRGENTSVEIGEYEQAGMYAITVESVTLGSENRETLDVRQRYLDDCNATSGRIDLREDGRIQIRLGRTDKGYQT